MTREIWVPNEEEFDEGDDYLLAEEIQELADEVIAKHFKGYLDDGILQVYYAWKKNGGSNSGRLKLGECQKISGLARHFAGQRDFAISLSADHINQLNLDDRQIEALVFHELCHIEVIDEGVYRLVGHDVELFYRELQNYGAWKLDLEGLVEVVREIENQAGWQVPTL